MRSEPDPLSLIVHAKREHRQRAIVQSVRVAVSQPANTVLDAGAPPIREVLDHTTVALGANTGTLNPLEVSGDGVRVKQVDVTARELVRMAPLPGAKLVGRECGVIAAGRRAALRVPADDSETLMGSVHPVQAVVRRATDSDVKGFLV